MKLPNFLIAGFPKCGSTSLHYYLKEHPDIFMPKQKELHYFTYDILMEQRHGPGDAEVKKFHVGSEDGYQRSFAKVGSEKAIGDASPSYANYADAIPRIKETLGDQTRILLVVRDPIRRAFSNYLHLVRENRETLPFYDALMKEEERREQGYSDFWYYTFNSMYSEKIKRIKESFDHVMVLTFEYLMESPESRIKEVYRFLGVNEDFVPSNLDTKFNPGGTYKTNPITRFVFGQSRLKSTIKKVIPITEGMKKAKIGVINKYKTETPQIDTASEAYLLDFFRSDVEELRSLGVQTQYWNKAFPAS